MFLSTITWALKCVLLSWTEVSYEFENYFDSTILGPNILSKSEKHYFKNDIHTSITPETEHPLDFNA